MPTTDTHDTALFDLATGIDDPRARTTDPDTSHLAADSTQANLSELQAIVLAILHDVPDFGLTDSELDRYYADNSGHRGWPSIRFETPRKRRSDLSKMGKLEDSGIRRLNPFGRLEVVWVVPA